MVVRAEAYKNLLSKDGVHSENIIVDHFEKLYHQMQETGNDCFGTRKRNTILCR